MKKRPYRKTTDCFIYDKKNKKIVAQDRGHYLALPGGGIDRGETPIKTGIREIKEEVAANVKNLYVFHEIKWDWFPEWADTAKRKQRYKKYKGEHIYLLVGDFVKFNKNFLGNEYDQWKGKKMMPINKAIKLAEKFYKKSHPNAKMYKLSQLLILKHLKYL